MARLKKPEHLFRECRCSFQTKMQGQLYTRSSHISPTTSEASTMRHDASRRYLLTMFVLSTFTSFTDARNLGGGLYPVEMIMDEPGDVVDLGCVKDPDPAGI